MGWRNECVLMLRYLIDDLSEDYSDDRLEHTLVVAAQLNNLNIDFDNTYTVDIDKNTVSPDPTTLSTKDDGFINLMVLRAAQIVVSSEAKTAASQAFTIKDGPSTIQTGDKAKYLQERAKSFQSMYDKAVIDYSVGGSRSGKAILGPTVVESIGGYNRF